MNDDRGFSTPLLLIMLAVMVLLLGGISIDLWRMVAAQRELTGVIDGAAVAAANALDPASLRHEPPAPQLDVVAASARACDYLNRHGGPRCGPDARVEVTADTVTITAQRDVPLSLLGFLRALDPDADTRPIRVAATARAVVRYLP